MKTIKIKMLAIVSLIAFGFTSCDDDENITTPAQQTIAAIAIANPDFSILETALTRTNLVTTLDGSGQFTVFAPTDAAFNTFFASLGSSVNVNNVDVNVLKSILLNHVIGSEIKSDVIPAATYVNTLSPINATPNAPTISMYVQKVGTTVTLNGGIDSKGAVVTAADIDASNGVIHIVNRVIQIPTVVDHVVDNPDFDTLQTVVTSTSGAFGDQSGVLNALSGLSATSPGTLFAPNNSALATATGAGGFANGATAAQVSRVLQYHVVLGNVRSNQLPTSPTTSVLTLASAPGNDIEFILGTNTVDVRDTANNLSRVFVADIQCSNGVIHGVNRVLQPSL